LVLTFHRSAQGYKMRCPSCGAVVRLRVSKPRRKAPPEETTILSPPPAEDAPLPDDIDVELVPMPEEPDEPRARPWRGRWILAAVAGFALLATGAGVAWWLLH